jgi:hypothetical protein
MRATTYKNQQKNRPITDRISEIGENKRTASFLNPTSRLVDPFDCGYVHHLYHVRIDINDKQSRKLEFLGLDIHINH